MKDPTFVIVYVRRSDDAHFGDSVRFGDRPVPFVPDDKKFDSPMEAMAALALSDTAIGGFRYGTAECWMLDEYGQLDHCQWTVNIC